MLYFIAASALTPLPVPDLEAIWSVVLPILNLIVAIALMLLGTIATLRSRARANSRRAAADLPTFDELVRTYSGYFCAAAGVVLALLYVITALHS
jgi:hypothetical protein